MKRWLFPVFLILCILFSACGVRPESPAASEASPPPPPQDIVTSTVAPTAASVPTAVPTPEATAAPTPTPTPEVSAAPAHSSMYIDGQTTEDVIHYFNEVCLDSEFIESGDPSYVQKWAAPISYMLHGTYTQTDYEVLTGLVTQLNGIYGFPGMQECYEEHSANLNIYFCTQQELNDRMGAMAQNELLDGAVTFWYDGMNQIYDAIICIRTDLDQNIRSSVILEEIYNGLGPIQDTTLRPDSIIYQHSSDALALTELDTLILQLLYHPDILCGMDAVETETVIRSLYY